MAVSNLSAASVLRRTMVDCQLRTFEITDPAIIAAFETVPREAFVGAGNAPVAYSDAILRVKAGDTIRALLAPMVLARMLQGANLKITDRALVVADGLGYSAAILGRLVASVVSLESDPAFAETAPQPSSTGGLGNVTPATGPLTEGWAAGAPYDFILINGAIEAGLRPLLDQLAPGGRLVCVVREPGQTGRSTRAKLFERLTNGAIGDKWLFDAAAEPLAAFRPAPSFAF